jgi:hypothetical protein
MKEADLWRSLGSKRVVEEVVGVPEGVEVSAPAVKTVAAVSGSGCSAVVAASTSAAAIAAAAAFFLARCSRRTWSVVALTWESLSSSDLSGTVPKTWLITRYEISIVR